MSNGKEGALSRGLFLLSWFREFYYLFFKLDHFTDPIYQANTWTTWPAQLAEQHSKVQEQVTGDGKVGVRTMLGQKAWSTQCNTGSFWRSPVFPGFNQEAWDPLAFLWLSLVTEEPVSVMQELVYWGLWVLALTQAIVSLNTGLSPL